ncbi:MAG: pyridoxal-dependent decarboxylase [Pyrinomonadaceae bacterium]
MTDKSDIELGDMPAEELRKCGHQLIDWVADYMSDLEKRPVFPLVQPGVLKSSLPSSCPESGEPMRQILDDVDRFIMPGLVHWNHPSFFAYFTSSGSGPGILAELICSALNVNTMLWHSSPAATELEEITLAWLREMTN